MITDNARPASPEQQVQALEATRAAIRQLP